MRGRRLRSEFPILTFSAQADPVGQHKTVARKLNLAPGAQMELAPSNYRLQPAASSFRLSNCADGIRTRIPEPQTPCLTD